MIVVADTGPIGYLVQLGLIHLLFERYGKVILPTAVLVELQHPHAPLAVRLWLHTLPPWVEIAEAGTFAASFAGHLGPGEREAITLAHRLGAELLLDDRAANLQARKLGLRPIGTLLVLAEAAQTGSINLPETLARLTALGFYLDAPLHARTIELGRRPIP